MSKFTYQEHVAALRSREVQPPFSRTVDLIASATPRARWQLPVTLAGAAILAGAILLNVSFNTPTHRTDVNPTRTPSMSSVLPANAGRTVTAPHPRVLRTVRQRAWPDQLIPQAEGEIPVEDTIELAPTLHLCLAQESSSVALLTRQDPRPVPPIALPDSETTARQRFFAFLGGAFSQQFSSTSVLRQLSFDDAFAGIGYNLSEHVAVKILGGGEFFALASSTQSVSFHDATFVHNGQATHNVIGVVLTSPAASIQRVDWLGGSVQYSFGEGLRPLAELTIAGSGNGLLSRQSIGVEHSLAESFDLSLLAQLSELLPQGSAWLTKAGVSASVTYRLW